MSARDLEGLERYLTIEQAADLLAVCSKTLRRRISEGEIQGYRIGPRAIRVKASDIDELCRPIPTAGTWPR